ncbi:pentatricopeptide repeat-containing protein At3g57430, chloroplastic-like [Macadamia integrifolia]|uniref:pentatricopeptide repeat-containing protein At3g57430, chloroplastic-like n=1 Tax=Macadamia integrifolia TaxID=60698 RepID=UPI001C501EFD|nr:pentatricopeptide repeat-containing protein At3g57430, chloroplastic-like [Macadamia integrifolia]
MPSLSTFICSSSLVSLKTCNQTQLKKPVNNAPPLTLPLAEEVFLNSSSSVRLLNSCAAERNLKIGLGIHAGVLKSGLAPYTFVANALLDFYSKCGQLEDAFKVFDLMPVKTIVSWTSMMSGCCQNGSADAAISIFQQMLSENMQPNEFTFAVLLQVCGQTRDLKLTEMIHGNLIVNELIEHQFLKYSMVDAYSKCGLSLAAEKLIKKSCCRDVVSWTMAISGCVLNGLIERAFVLFSDMLADGVAPNRVTFQSMIQACSLLNRWLVSRCIHGFVIKSQLYMDTLVTNSLIQMYSNNGYYEESIKIFWEFCFRGDGPYLRPETMATLLQGCGHLNCLRQGKEVHGYLIRHRFLPCIVVENSLVDMYAENKQDHLAFRIFGKMNEKDIISWNTLISCLVKNGCPSEALMLLGKVHSNEGEGVVPDSVTVLTSLQSCSELASFDMGQVMHGYITRSGFGNDIFIGNALVTMYGKSGRICYAKKVFEEMPTKDTGSWNAMIAAYRINGDGISALQTLGRMRKLGIYQPNAVTFVNVFSACSHSGLVEEAFECFSKMDEEYGVQPSMEHYACMVDLLGRQGRLDEAEDFIKKMPFRPGQSVWGALLGSCGLSRNVEVAERAASKLSILEPEGKVWRVTMSNVYAGVERWEDAVKLRLEMKHGQGLRKDPGWSGIEVRGVSYRFVAGDTRHPESEKIYKVLKVTKEHIQTVIHAHEILASQD